MEIQKTNNSLQRRRPRVVIVGGGFAGLNAAKELAGEDVDVLLIDRNNYHKFQPLLYQVATAGLEPEKIAHNLRDIFRRAENVNFRLGAVTRIDGERQQAYVGAGEAIDYDYLILAPGAVTTFFGIEGAEAHSFPLKNVPDAVSLRNHVLRQFELRDRHPERVDKGVLNFVVVGGGPTGVEMAGAFVELFKVMQHDYHGYDTSEAQVFLLEQLDTLLPSYAESLRTYTQQVLEERGVEVRTGTTVERVTERAVHLKGGEQILTETLVWAAGVKAHPVVETLRTPQKEAGRLATRPDLRIAAHPEIFVAGDVNGMDAHGTGLYPQLAQVAIQQGKHAARQILRLLEGKSTKPFVYNDLGQMATIGRNAAVAELAGGVKFKGFIAYIMWAFIHIAALIGFRDRVLVFLSWIYDYFTYDRSARLILEVVPDIEQIEEKH